jgi:tetratricopeptide (TPR) repeat protein
MLGRHEAAVAAAPDDPEVLLAYAEELLSTAIGPFAGVFEPGEGDAERFRKARELASRASPADGRALGLLGTTYLVESGLAGGIAYLEKARSLLPQRMDFALNLYAMYLRTGDDAKAAALFASAFERSRDRQIAFAARNVRLTVEVDRANALTRSGNLDEAAIVLRRLAESTPDANARRELESEASRLESLAIVNRHIRMYNDAVALANANRRSDALELLAQLLQVATDPLVVRDAKQLEDKMRRR